MSGLLASLLRTFAHNYIVQSLVKSPAFNRFVQQSSKMVRDKTISVEVPTASEARAKLASRVQSLRATPHGETTQGETTTGASSFAIFQHRAVAFAKAFRKEAAKDLGKR